MDDNNNVIEFAPERVLKNATRPMIRFERGALEEIADQAEAALIASGIPFYVQGGALVRPIIDEAPGFRGKTRTIRVKALNEDYMILALSRACRWEKWDGRPDKYQVIDPPRAIANILLARDGHWTFPQLNGIRSTPTLRPDGTLLSAPGYDVATGLLLLEPPALPPMPDRPTREQALAALAQLTELLGDFPFVGEADRAVALSALMTPVVRGGMAVAPLHVVTAPEAGTGKSYLIDLASAIALGEVAVVFAAGRKEEETEKRLGAVVLSGQPLISIDNLNGELGGDFLCQAVERPRFKTRVLGKSTAPEFANSFCLYANGNNLRISGDLVRRAVVCSLDANMERPELRRFHDDPVRRVLAERGCYVAAILTICRAYLCAGCPDLAEPLPSFEDWSRLVRSALIWLGEADPLKTMETAHGNDPSRENLANFVVAWQETFGPRHLTVSEMIATTDERMQRAMLAVAGHRSGRAEVDPLRLGKYLSRHQDRMLQRHKITAEYDTGLKQKRWCLLARHREHPQTPA